MELTKTEPQPNRWRTLARPFRVLPWFFVTVLLCLGGWETALRLSEGRVRQLDESVFPYDMGDRLFHLREVARSGRPLDLLVLGDSMPQAGLAPPELRPALGGPDATIVSLAGMGWYPSLTADLARYALDTLGCRPRRVIVGFGPVALNARHPGLPALIRDLDGYPGVRMLSGSERPTDDVRIWKYRRALRRLIETGPPLTHLPEGATEVSALWYAGNTAIFDDLPAQQREDMFRRFVVPALDGFGMDESVTEPLRQTAERLRDAGAEVTLLSGPVYPHFADYGCDPGPALATIHREFSAMAQKEKVRYVDAETAPAARERRFYLDPVHLNRDGAVAFSRWLAAELWPSGRAATALEDPPAPR